MPYQKLSYQLDQNPVQTPIYGLIVLKSDETIENESRFAFPPEQATLYVSRIESSTEVTKQSLRDLALDLPRAAGLFPTPTHFDVVGLGCTSGATMIGSDQVAKLTHQACKTRHVTDPMQAVISYCKAFNIERIGFISPYIPAVSAAMRLLLENHKIEIAEFASFETQEEAMTVRISEDSLLNATIKIGASKTCQAIFLSCTNLRTRSLLPKAVQALNKPVISSNYALFWHMQQLASLKKT